MAAKDTISIKGLCVFARHGVFPEENKLGRLLRIANNVNGSGIVYMRNRKGTVEISKFLNDNNISQEPSIT